MDEKFVDDRPREAIRDYSLWDYALAVYSQPAIQAQCLHLQDRYELDVNLLLAAGYWACAQRCWSNAQVDELVAESAELRENYVLPLRALRTNATGPKRKALYQALKTAELAAERLQIDAIAHLLSVMPSSAQPDDANEYELNLQAYARVYTGRERVSLTTDLAELAAAMAAAVN
ncbi:MAG: TIGR02444 family protein [Zhongshania sp.]|uniref:TIGR02444 family protein n=1 Tax=Zhongshania sp. TaxID=1971902 RepID=UPI0026025CE5|nr:TIGR02444 family protein [Zhongshania sp.]MDF1693236.1 TIGR02444 family protein [Zhongshania sp.]